MYAFADPTEFKHCYFFTTVLNTYFTYYAHTHSVSEMLYKISKVFFQFFPHFSIKFLHRNEVKIVAKI